MADEQPPLRDPDELERALGGLRPPDHVGGYTILDVLGEGGMGTVYLAEESDPARRVALKVIKPGMDSREVLRRFRYEQRTLAGMSHDAIAKVFRVDATEQQLPYFVMELVEGEPIDVHCDLWQLDLDARLQLIQTVCAAVQHAHDRGAVHRDLKPGNVLVERQGDEHRPKVIDFGLARALERDDAATATAHDQVMGTLEYMAPEQVDRQHRAGVGVHTDVYALGVLLYQLVTGELPLPQLRQANDAERQRIIAHDEPPSVGARVAADLARRADALQLSPRALRRLARRELSWITARAMHKDPARRYASAADLAADLQRLRAGEAVAAGPDAISYRVGKFLRRRRLESAAAMLIGASLVAGAFGLLNGAAQARASSAQALRTTARLAQERGDWPQALASLAAAEAAGYRDPVDLSIARVLAHVGALDDRASSAELARLAGMSVPAHQQGRVLLLRGIFANRALAPDAGLDLVRAALTRGGLTDDERDLAAYLLAETFDDARAAVERAVARDPHDRLAVLAEMSLLFCGGLVDDAVAFGRQLEIAYPRDPIVVVPRLLEAVLAGDSETAGVVVASSPGFDEGSDEGLDEGFADAMRQLARAAKIAHGVDDLLVSSVFDMQEFDLGKRVQLSMQTMMLPVYLGSFLAETRGEAPQRMLRTLGSMVPPCWARGYPLLLKLLPLSLSLEFRDASEAQDDEIRRIFDEAADRTGLAVLRFVCGYLHGMRAEHAEAVAEYERAQRAGQLVPVPRCIDRGLLASSQKLWRVAAPGERAAHRERALAALRRLLPHARRAAAFRHFLDAAGEFGDAAAVVEVLDAWRRHGDDPDHAAVRRSAIQRELQHCPDAPIAAYLQAELAR